MNNGDLNRLSSKVAGVTYCYLQELAANTSAAVRGVDSAIHDHPADLKLTHHIDIAHRRAARLGEE